MLLIEKGGERLDVGRGDAALGGGHGSELLQARP
jgi:hypothetical protein